MCMECRQTPCHPRCPNAPEPPILVECAECGYEIYDGDYYYNVNGTKYCEACIGSFLRTAEVDDRNED